MTPSELKHAIESRGTESHFFDRRTMRFFGDSMRNYGVRAVTVRAWGDTVDPVTGRYELITVEAWELYRRRPVKHGNAKSHFFRRDTFEQCHGVQA